MGVKSFYEEIPSKVSPNRLFKALVIDNHNLLPKMMPEFVKSAEIIQGNGGPGSIKQVNFKDDAPFKYMKYRIDEVDETNFRSKYTLIEGGELNEDIDFVVFDTKFEPSPEGGSVCKLKREFHIKEGAKVNESELDAQKDKGMMIFQKVEAYLVENPQVYA